MSDPQPVLDCVELNAFDIIFGKHAFYGQDSQLLAVKVLQHLMTEGMVHTDGQG